MADEDRGEWPTDEQAANLLEVNALALRRAIPLMPPVLQPGLLHAAGSLETAARMLREDGLDNAAAFARITLGEMGLLGEVDQ